MGGAVSGRGGREESSVVGEAGRIGGYVGRRGEEGMQSGKQDGGPVYYAILYLLWPAIIYKRTSCQEERPRLTHQLTRLFKCYSRKLMSFLLQEKVCLIIRLAWWWCMILVGTSDWLISLQLSMDDEK